MKSHLMAAVMGTALLAATPVLSTTAVAQPAPPGTTSGYMVPVVVGAAVGATVGALLWPVIFPAPAIIATPGAVAAVAPEAMGWGLGAFMTTRAAVGAAVGGAMGYVMGR